MKKLISLMLSLFIFVSSSVFCFADFTSTDSTNLSNIYKYMPTASQVTTLNNTLSTISTRVLNIYNALFDGNHSVAYWIHAIDSFMSPILTAIQHTPTELESIKRLLGYVSYEGETEVIDPYLVYNSKSVAQLLTENKDFFDLKYGYFGPNDNNPSGAGTWVGLWGLNGDGSMSSKSAYFRNTNLLGVLPWYLNLIANNTAIHGNIDGQNWTNLKNNILGGYTRPNNFTNWLTNEDQSFTVDTFPTMLATWLMNIQKPVARLSYVLASDQDIEAREAAADNQQAVVDNFIDSSGSAAVSTSDFGSVSDLSSGFKNNIATDASVTGIWNIFNTDNFGWFSQETADQLDTSNSSTRTLRSSGSYPTPLLDKQTEDILKYIGGENND